MNKYLIKIKANNGATECITINGDSTRPFQIAHNLWNYLYPGYASHKLNTIAKSWENNGLTVERYYGTIIDMPTQGDQYNVKLKKHGELTWYSGVCDENYVDGEYVGRENFIYD